MVAIFPFEVDAYRRAGAEISFVGNPLVDTVQPSMSTFEAKKIFGIKAGSHPVLLLPGSRRQEIGLLLPVMLASAERLAKACPATEFFLPVAPNVDTVQLRQMIAAAGVEVHLTTEYTYDLMGIADFAIAASGTVVMEAAIMGLPSIVLYRMSPFTYFIGRLLVHVESFSLPNILLGRPLQPELLQAEVTPERIVQEARGLYAGQEKAIAVKAGLAEAVSRLGAPGASERVANLIYLAAKKSQESTKGIMGA
jgi:lipid-A-disaccharide synthase